jgi:hypothetical protein
MFGVAALLTSAALAYPSLLTCAMELGVGAPIMIGPAVAGGQTVGFKGKKCGDTYTKGEALTATFTGSDVHWMMQISGAKIVGGDCGDEKGGTRFADNATVTLDPTSYAGPINLFAGSASAYGVVSISPNCTLTAA